uniref:Uncharacterized protein n=1 Tax=Setaria italica TaxID=4555 RepID=K3XZQ9_SETIT
MAGGGRGGLGGGARGVLGSGARGIGRRGAAAMSRTRGRGRVSQGGGRDRGRVAELGSDDVAGLGGEPIGQDVAAAAAQHSGVKKTSKRKASDTVMVSCVPLLCCLWMTNSRNSRSSKFRVNVEFVSCIIGVFFCLVSVYLIYLLHVNPVTGKIS